MVIVYAILLAFTLCLFSQIARVTMRVYRSQVRPVVCTHDILPEDAAAVVMRRAFRERGGR